MSNERKIIKFHGAEVKNVIILYAIRPNSKPVTIVIEQFDALKNEEHCETINIQVVADFVTITLYKQESSNSILRRELIPTHSVEHIWIEDL
ncbi:MAG: hypothetical protein M3224_05980 [Thermoproteota archaeon]|jgi:hypothetical protein|nr:hypothetical protein [Thermoproteota archaeon]MDQ3970955.1 hypothetical protein [Thermoproteota archaeon]MDQ4023257.1 hypothetical protein [Thermoproteota archaeon]